MIARTLKGEAVGCGAFKRLDFGVAELVAIVEWITPHRTRRTDGIGVECRDSRLPHGHRRCFKNGPIGKAVLLAHGIRTGIFRRRKPQDEGKPTREKVA
jgi:hypothetical protein